MYIDLRNMDEEEKLRALKEQVGNDVVIHYECENCGDDQVTDPTEITCSTIDDLVEDGYFMVSWPCTECGTNVKFMRLENINGMED